MKDGISRIVILVAFFTHQSVLGFHQLSLQFDRNSELIFLTSLDQDPSEGLRVTDELNVLPYLGDYRAVIVRGIWIFFEDYYHQGRSVTIEGNGEKATIPDFDLKNYRSCLPLSNPNDTSKNQFRVCKEMDYGNCGNLQDNQKLGELNMLDYKSITVTAYSRHVIMCKESGQSEDYPGNCVCLNGRRQQFYAIRDLTAVYFEPENPESKSRVRKMKEVEPKDEKFCEYELRAYTEWEPDY